ncbi:hypothetical protein F5Y03DRAFT_364811 [Xylaria venustula]|nr:hypothetical protein F5Y03DRAFT_364811 [Xylaria venustula]
MFWLVTSMTSNRPPQRHKFLLPLLIIHRLIHISNRSRLEREIISEYWVFHFGLLTGAGLGLGAGTGFIILTVVPPRVGGCSSVPPLYESSQCCCSSKKYCSAKATCSPVDSCFCCRFRFALGSPAIWFGLVVDFALGILLERALGFQPQGSKIERKCPYCLALIGAELVSLI